MYKKSEKELYLAQLHASGMSVNRACESIPGFPGPGSIYKWLKEEEAGELDPPVLEVAHKAPVRKHTRYSDATKREAVRLLRQGMRPCEVKRRLRIRCHGVVDGWLKKANDGTLFPTEGADSSARTKKETAMPRIPEAGPAKDGEGQTTWRDWAADLPDDPNERLAAMERKYIEMGAVLDVLKAPGPGSLTNAEKWEAGQRARAEGVPLTNVCTDLSIAKSTYEAQPAIAAKADKYAALRVRVRASFEASGRRYGSESVWADLRRPASDGRTAVKAAQLEPGDMVTPVIVSEKVVRRVMAEGGMAPVTAKSPRRRYSSYAGEPDERPGNLPLREDGTHDFHADGPFELVVTDVTEFTNGSWKCYLSPAIDCWDGAPLAWSISRHPDSRLCNSMLEEAADKAGHGFVVHTDGGVCYRGDGWKRICSERGITRSMSRKARSPDNARAEGFFGILKQEFFHCREWTGVGYDEFVSELNAYIVWYRDSKIKKSLGWKTIREYREGQGVAV